MSIDHPFQLAALPNAGPNDPYGCVMNVVAWMHHEGRYVTTPSCVNRHLASLTQIFNDNALDRFGERKRNYPGLSRPVGVATPYQTTRMLEIIDLVSDTAAVDTAASWNWVERKAHELGVDPNSMTIAEKIVRNADTFDEAIDNFLELLRDFHDTHAHILKEDAYV